MVLIAHLSDIHLSPLPKLHWHELFSKRITGYLNWKIKRSKHMQTNTLLNLVEHLKTKNVDFTTFTGDLVNLSLDKEFSNAANWIKQIVPPEKSCVIPGNHDAYLSGSLAKFETAFAQYTKGETIDNQHYPFVRRIGDVAIIACSSAVPTMPFMAYGKFEKKQAQRLASQLQALGQQGLFRIVIIHHPPAGDAAFRFRKGLHGVEMFQQTIKENGAELILHGHTHRSTIHAITGVKNGGLNGETPVIGVAAASANATHGDDPARYNLFDIKRTKNGFSCQMKEFGYQDLATEIVERMEKTLY